MSGSDEEVDTVSDSPVPSSGDTRRGPYSLRLLVAYVVGLVGIALYNWWVWVVVATNLLTSTDAFFSDLEATGRPDASLFQHLDLAAGIAMLAALMIRGPLGPLGRRKEWRWLLLFAIAGTIGGRFAYACPEGLSAACRANEWHLRLPVHHYVHVVAGIVEFATMTVAVVLARRRTREHRDWVARSITGIAWAMVIGYPLLGVAYLSDRFGSFVEPIFFVCFSLMVAVELFETRRSSTTDGVSFN